MLNIRNASIDDIALIRELTFNTWPQTYRFILSEDQIAYMLEMMYSKESLERQFRSGNSFLICYDEGQPVGFASWSEILPRVFKLHKIYVLPSIQGKGVGRYMIDHVIDEIKKKSAITLELNVNRYNPAKLFYERLGFEVIRNEDIDIGNGYFMNDHVMRYNLTGN
jgi:ribosomal protein S18 acetylase RimI-like enzyme